jgi:hypothetical protein
MQKTSTLLLLLALLTTHAVSAQHEKHKIRAAIDRMFEGMLSGDGEMVESTFVDDAMLTSTGTRDDQPFAQRMSASQFASAVAQGGGGWDERIWDVNITIKDNLATAWMDYAFYHNADFSHCGQNSFQLARMADGNWKTVALADTRTSGRCMYDQNKAEETMVRAALKHYLDGHATGDGAHHSMVFNEIANLYWIRDGEFNQRTSEAYISGASGSPADNESERVRYIDWVDVTGTAAVGKIILDYPGRYFVDYMSLLKIDGRWQIVNKIFDIDSE